MPHCALDYSVCEIYSLIMSSFTILKAEDKFSLLEEPSSWFGINGFEAKNYKFIIEEFIGLFFVFFFLYEQKEFIEVILKFSHYNTFRNLKIHSFCMLLVIVMD